ncbi:hypothetical protein MHYP_G00184030 [Metynnis hypsauchen]
MLPDKNAAHDTQVDDIILLPHRLGATSPSLMARDDSEGDPGLLHALQSSARALNTHKCHVHPAVHNRKRILEAQMQRGSTEWTEQEVALLRQLVAEFARDPEATSLVVGWLPGKSHVKDPWDTSSSQFSCLVAVLWVLPKARPAVRQPSSLPLVLHSESSSRSKYPLQNWCMVELHAGCATGALAPRLRT